MAETMSQAEIDALLAAMSGGGDDSISDEPEETKSDKKIREHDFRNPKFFSKEQLRSISVIYDNYAKHLSAFMTGMLRTECSVTAQSVEEQTYFEYSNALLDSIMLGILEVKPLEGHMLMEISRNTCYAIIERLLGGDSDEPFVQDDFTDIEIKLMERFYRQIIRFLKDSWSNVTDMEPNLDSLATNARLTQIMPLEEIVIIVLFTVRIKEHEGSMGVCVPCINLDKLLGEAQNYTMSSRKRKKDEIDRTTNSIFDHVKTSKLDIRGILGSTTQTLQAVSHLQVGDVIPLDKPVDSPVILRIGAVDWFEGEIGTRRNKIAVKIKNNILRKSQ